MITKLSAIGSAIGLAFFWAGFQGGFVLFLFCWPVFAVSMTARAIDIDIGLDDRIYARKQAREQEGVE